MVRIYFEIYSDRKSTSFQNDLKTLNETRKINSFLFEMGWSGPDQLHSFSDHTFQTQLIYLRVFVTAPTVTTTMSFYAGPPVFRLNRDRRRKFHRPGRLLVPVPGAETALRRHVTRLELAHRLELRGCSVIKLSADY